MSDQSIHLYIAFYEEENQETIKNYQKNDIQKYFQQIND